MFSQLSERWLWALALELDKHYDYQHAGNPLGKEGAIFKDIFGRPLDQTWLVRNEGRQYELIRLQVVDDLAPSTISRDVRQFSDQVPMFRKQLKAKSLAAHVVYICSQPITEAYVHLLQEMETVDGCKSSVHLQAVYVREGWHPQHIEVDGFDASQWGMDLEQIEANIEYVIQTKDLNEIKNDLKEEEQKKEQEFYGVFHYGKAYLTALLLMVNVMIFLFLESVGSSMDPRTLIDYGAKWNPSIVAGEYWRLITPMFLHIGWLHLIFNSVALFFLGGAVERIFGTPRFTLMYVFAGFTGALASFAFTPHLSAGASGAIFGCFGALLYFGLKNRNLFFRTMGRDVIFILILNLGIGFAIPMIDNYGHIGGLIGGFLAAAMVNLPRQAHWKERWMALFVSLIAILVVSWIGFAQIYNAPDVDHLQIVESAIQNEEYDEAERYLQEIITFYPESSDAYAHLARVYLEQGQEQDALHVLEKALLLDVGNAEIRQLYEQISDQMNETEGVR